MSYDAAINKAWEELLALNPPANLSVRLLADEYSVDFSSRKLISLACNVPAKDYTAILILHYLNRQLKGLPALTGEWLTFKELSGIEGYEQAFKHRVIERLIRKYGANPASMLSALERFPGKRVSQADVSIVLEVFPGVPALIEMWKPDEEFGPEANILFDKSIGRIFSTEDVVVLAEFTVSQL